MEQTNGNDILRKQVDNIEKEVNQLEKEKEIIKQSCKHQDGFDINFDESKSIKKYCSTCKRDVGFASTQEQKDFFKPKGN